MTEPGIKTLTIPHPTVRPLGQKVTRDELRAVWEVFVKPGQDAGELQSIEDRILMGVLRAVYEGLPETESERRLVSST